MLCAGRRPAGAWRRMRGLTAGGAVSGICEHIPILSPMRHLALLLFLASVTASAQPYALRLADDALRDDAVSAAEIVRHLHALAPGAEEPQEVILMSALVADGEVIETGRTAFLAAPARRVGGGTTLSSAGVRLDRRYRQRRAERPIDADVLAPAMRVGGRQFPGEMLFPGEMSFPGEMLVPGTMPDGEPGAVPAARFVGGTARMSAGEIDQDALIRAASAMDRWAYESGEPFLIVWIVPVRGEGETEIVGFIRR